MVQSLGFMVTPAPPTPNPHLSENPLPRVPTKIAHPWLQVIRRPARFQASRLGAKVGVEAGVGPEVVVRPVLRRLDTERVTPGLAQLGQNVVCKVLGEAQLDPQTPRTASSSVVYTPLPSPPSLTQFDA
eukprot:CAMPEP_0181354940 /NCGR_PEP_ID=MMETSP1106-20121128/3629_1 /TAXON_ID=81844 /ORGANISM="Mantoniella antarctica, Strain SL-175" /LENGTH=128 /DNA_ID=CAMNT_0023467637 /DNA_START=105 /DNA_END=491 /DNA_ORIENTATION=+